MGIATQADLYMCRKGERGGARGETRRGGRGREERREIMERKGRKKFKRIEGEIILNYRSFQAIAIPNLKL